MTHIFSNFMPRGNNDPIEKIIDYSKYWYNFKAKLTVLSTRKSDVACKGCVSDKRLKFLNFESISKMSCLFLFVTIM